VWVDDTGLAVALELDAVVEHLRAAGWAMLGPLAALLFAATAAAVLVHVLQTGGLWAPALAAPDVARLWAAGGEGAAARAGRGVWSIAKGVVALIAAAWVIRIRAGSLAGLTGRDDARTRPGRLRDPAKSVRGGASDDARAIARGSTVDGRRPGASRTASPARPSVAW
jgi:hypothetical protein